MVDAEGLAVIRVRDRNTVRAGSQVRSGEEERDWHERRAVRREGQCWSIVDRYLEPPVVDVLVSEVRKTRS